ncbi:MAG: hypothetical protein J5449_04740 [Oscillospiraceae bacterium]|nr:hypothetical protein [Oscillospiraceae bacterium]
MYIITEIQTDANGKVSTLVTQKQSRTEAESTYHSILAAAALSSLPCHAATITDETGFPLMQGYYRHGPEDE